MFSRRAFLASTALGAAYARGAPVTAPGRLSSLTADVAGIPGTEYQQRLARLQSLLQQSQVAALLVEAGSSLEYFTGIQWWRSERTTAAVIPALGDTVVVTPYFESPSVSESLKITADVRTWKEDASPFELIAAAVRERAKDNPRVAVESTTRYFIVEGIRQAANSRFDLLSGEPYVRACRMKKSAAELALMQAANNVTMAAIRHAHAHVSAGMRSDDVLDLIVTA
ncbi:MAG: aminopeptidase P family N-terminal domain-containing protein, partial [Sinobacteraceae bacterium]|nr:aminopeptidase P family N-terminal domain-containing protein [Nevskiaceae bacterium]